MSQSDDPLINLIYIIRKMITSGWSKEMIINRLDKKIKQEEIYLAYNAAMVLIKNGLKG